ncbi:hypothetical protein [Singulisphaera sp. PoT]|uniref:hypothetical protein n=1 Tax=Singulisphaera sp. PoT TaxID=3411797 RepID=UPI003BF4803A
MSSNHRRNPISAPSSRARCPVCLEAVYSRSGIHPQCALRQAESQKPGVQPNELPAVNGND